jgi:AraC-like DNA-binding protein
MKQTELNNNFYQEYFLNKPTERFVKMIWTINNSSERTFDKKVILPNGCFYLAIVTGLGVDVFIENKQFELKSGVFLCSQMSERAIVKLKKETNVIFIQLQAWTTSYTYKNDLSNFINTIREVNPEKLLFHNKPNAYLTMNLSQVIKIVNQFFTNCDEKYIHQNDIELTCNQVIKQKGDIKTSELLKTITTTQRTFQNHFKKTTGLNLTQFIKIVKLRFSVDDLLESKHNQNLTDIALKNQYYDQAHFIKTFKTIVKVTPHKFNPDEYLLS